MQECEYKIITDYKTAFSCFNKRFLNEKKSIFRLDNDEEILNIDSIRYLVDNFIYNGYGGDASFLMKIKHQLVIKPKESKDTKDTKDTIVSNAIEILAHIVWLWRLVPTNAKQSSTINSVLEILYLSDDFKNISLDDNPFFNEDINGIVKTGTYYNTNKPFEMAFVVKFLDLYIQNHDNKSEIDILNNVGDVVISTTGLLNKDGSFTIYNTDKKDDYSKSASIFHALLHFFDPNNYEAIISNEHKSKIINTFEDLICEDRDDIFYPEIDWKIKCIKNNLGANNYQGIYFFYQENIKRLWNNDSLHVNKNIIYYGSPGTGKTFGIMKELESDNDSTIEFVQFHPSFSYEDFIEGIKPTDSSDMKLVLQNGLFKQMCIDAFEELKNAFNENRTPKKFYFIADEINRAELSRVFGELLVCIEEDKRVKIVDNKIEGMLIKTQYASMWKKEHIVLNINTNTKELDINGEPYFGVPENIYFIGTMNDIDKSIDSFDLALRRRFIWIEKKTNYKLIKDKYNEKYKKSCERLNKEIADTVGEKYQLGHAYFLKIIQINGTIPDISKKILFEIELKPILEEYLRTIIDENEIKTYLEKMKKIFIK